MKTPQFRVGDTVVITDHLRPWAETHIDAPADAEYVVARVHDGGSVTLVGDYGWDIAGTEFSYDYPKGKRGWYHNREGLMLITDDNDI